MFHMRGYTKRIRIWYTYLAFVVHTFILLLLPNIAEIIHTKLVDETFKMDVLWEHYEDM